MQTKPNRQTTLDKIRAALTGDPRKDAAFLNELTRQTSNDEEGRAVKREIGRLLLKLTPINKRLEWRRKFEKTTQEFNDALAAARRELSENHCENALAVLRRIETRFGGLFDEDARTKYYFFRNPLDETICERFFPTEKAPRRAPVDYPGLYFSLGSVLYELRRATESQTALKKGLAFNPVNLETLWIFADANKRTRDFREYLRTTTNALRFSLTPKDLARGYRNLGAFYLEAERYEIASSLYYFSATFDDDPAARRELRFIELRTRRASKAPPFDKIRKLFEKEEIQLGFNVETLRVVNERGVRARDENDLELARRCFEIVRRASTILN